MPAGDRGHWPVNKNCFNIDKEIEYWISRRQDFNMPPVHAEDAAFVAIVKFAYDGYLICGKIAFEDAGNILMNRYGRQSVRLSCTWNYAEPVCRAVWRRMLFAEE